MEYFSTQEEKIYIFKWPHNVLFIVLTPMKYQTIFTVISFAMRGVIHYVTIATLISPTTGSHAKQS